MLRKSSGLTTVGVLAIVFAIVASSIAGFIVAKPIAQEITLTSTATTTSLITLTQTQIQYQTTTLIQHETTTQTLTQIQYQTLTQSVTSTTTSTSSVYPIPVNVTVYIGISGYNPQSNYQIIENGQTFEQGSTSANATFHLANLFQGENVLVNFDSNNAGWNGNHFTQTWLYLNGKVTAYGSTTGNTATIQCSV